MLTALLGTAVVALLGGPESGLAIGANVPAFHPQHVTGPHKGTDACPP